MLGRPADAPYDRILVSAAADTLPRPSSTSWPPAASWSCPPTA
ncbi:hypothetical protein [Nocardioides sp. TF02-7]|nr:hypothetical protein [Nocardioides sp. TF02-7]